MLEDTRPTFIEILSSDSDCQPSSPTKNDGAVLTNPPRLTYPIAKQYHLQTQPNQTTQLITTPPNPTSKTKTKTKTQTLRPLFQLHHHNHHHSRRLHIHTLHPTTTSTSNSNRPPSKRTKKTHKSSTTAFQKHTKHWELDGNTLVQIKHVRFKLQRSRLARHGEWFRHTFEQADAAPELYEDEVLHLDRLGIIVRDFSTLLDALDDATYAPQPPILPHTLFYPTSVNYLIIHRVPRVGYPRTRNNVVPSSRGSQHRSYPTRYREPRTSGLLWTHPCEETCDV
ncbi:hypothetical protein L208DRAFT_1398549 [Tricholoma matsutake]|nr:hypothetical protein L208DRAFT_1398549 [Tricholoma matsutake 945]